MADKHSANSRNSTDTESGRHQKALRESLEKLRATLRADILLLSLAGTAAIILCVLLPSNRSKFIESSTTYLKEMVMVLPAVLILMGLFTVWVKRETVVRLLGEGSGISGILLGIFLGTLPTGPLYIAFPLASMLLKKGARIATVMAFLSAWACIKIPQELVEIQFLGIRFALLRLFTTVALLIPMVLIAESFHNRHRENTAS